MDAQIIGNYRLEAPLGKGAMGLVYRARHLALDKDVAIKFMMPSLSDNPVFCARFLQEARLMARIDHPNIVRVLDSGEYEHRRFLVMEFLQGETLEDRLRRQPPLSAEEASRIAAATLSALVEIHSKSVVHRDIKPANIFLCTNGAIKVMDFGIARELAETGITVTGTVIGTPEYMSPEQADGRKVDGRSDLYSVGVVLYEMLNGKPPFTAEIPLAILNMHVNKPVPPLAPSVPALLRRVVSRALAKQPASRFQTAREMLDALTVAPPRQASPVPWKVWAAVAGVALLPIVCAGMVKVHNDQIHTQAESLAREAFTEMTHAHLDTARFKAQESLKLDPHNVNAQAALGAALVETYNASDKSDDLRAAHKAMEPLISHSPDNAYSYAALGALDFAYALNASLTADCERARDKLQAAKNRDPNLAYVFYKLGMVEKRLGETTLFSLLNEHPKAAEIDFKQAISLDPHIAWAHTELAAVYFGQKQYADCGTAAQGEIDAGTPTARTYNYLGISLSVQGKHADADAKFRKAIELDSTIGVYHYNLAGELIVEARGLIIDRAKLAEASRELKSAIDHGYAVPETDRIYKELASHGFAPDIPVRFAPLGEGFEVAKYKLEDKYATGGGQGRRFVRGDIVYFVCFWDEPVSQGTATARMDQEVHEISRYTITSHSDVTAISGASGKEFRFVEGSSKQWYVRFFPYGQRLYEVGISAPANVSMPDDAAEFINSFKLIGLPTWGSEIKRSSISDSIFKKFK